MGLFVICDAFLGKRGGVCDNLLMITRLRLMSAFGISTVIVDRCEPPRMCIAEAALSSSS